LRPPPPPPLKPYKAVAAKPAQPFNDPSFEAFRKELADVAARKDRAALAKLVVAKGFFWVQDRELADDSKPGIDYIAQAMGLENADSPGWANLAAYAIENTAAPVAERKGVICAPAPPEINLQEAQALGEATQTDPTDWGYMLRDGAEVRAAGRPDAPVIEKLGLILIHILPDSAAGDANLPTFLHIATPSGKSGYVAIDAVAPLITEQMCYANDGGSWKITGYVGGVSP
jgi:hypothetical protein